MMMQHSGLPDDIRWHWVAQYHGLPALLAPHERLRCRSFGSAARRASFVAGRTAVKQLVGRIYAMAPGQVAVRVNADDSPGLDQPGYISLAHSGDWAAAVWASHPIGIDVEHIQQRDPDLVHFLFSPDDQATLDTLPGNRSEQLVLAWTLKEAVLKARRSGFRCSPKAIQLQVDAAAGSAHATVKDTNEHWHLHFGRRTSYWWAVAYAV